MDNYVDPALTHPDKIVLQNLTDEIISGYSAAQKDSDNRKPADEATIKLLQELNDSQSSAFEVSVFTTWDLQDIPDWLKRWLINPYITVASAVVRRPTDVVFLTHILLYLSTSLPSAVRLYSHFSWLHAIGHWLLQSYYCGSFTLMMHNHIHNNGILQKRYIAIDGLWPYMISPLMGHTWNSYYYHHVKHHHAENNGPGDLSSTIRYQRDELLDFLCYVGRFVFFIWIELPVYFIRKQKFILAVKAAFWEQASYLCLYLLAKYNLRATVFVLLIPLVQMRVGMMVGNWGQHALVDEQDPDSDFRSSITLLDVSVSLSDPISSSLAAHRRSREHIRTQ